MAVVGVLGEHVVVEAEPGLPAGIAERGPGHQADVGERLMGGGDNPPLDRRGRHQLVIRVGVVG